MYYNPYVHPKYSQFVQRAAGSLEIYVKNIIDDWTHSSVFYWTFIGPTNFTTGGLPTLSKIIGYPRFIPRP